MLASLPQNYRELKQKTLHSHFQSYIPHILLPNLLFLLLLHHLLLLPHLHFQNIPPGINPQQLHHRPKILIRQHRELGPNLGIPTLQIPMNAKLLNRFLHLARFFILAHEFGAVGRRADYVGDLGVEGFQGEGFGGGGVEEDDFVAGGGGEGEEEGERHFWFRVWF